jgi:hypothetical protein
MDIKNCSIKEFLMFNGVINESWKCILFDEIVVIDKINEYDFMEDVEYIEVEEGGNYVV